MKKALSILLSVLLLFAALPLTAGAVTADLGATGVDPEGSTDNCSWTLAADGTLTLSGTGATDFYEAFRFSDERIKKIVVGEGITAIGDDLFSGCNKATELTLPSTLVSIGDRAFLGCSKLAYVTMPASLKSIGSQAFSDCYALNSVTLNDGLEKVDFRAFVNTAMMEITVPATVTEIGSQAFGIENYSVIEGFTVRGAADSAAEEYAAYYEEDGMIFEPIADGSTYVLTGDDWLNNWSVDPDQYMMTKDGDVYTITVPDVPATPQGKNYSLKVVEITENETIWHGQVGSNLSVFFRLTAAGDVTVTYDPETKEITVTGPTVTGPAFDVSYITAVGNGRLGNSYLNGISWDNDAEANRMTEVSEGVYEITFKDVDAGFNYQVKFAANGSWTINWGGESSETSAESGVEYPAAFDGENIYFDIDEDGTTVTLRLDLTGFDPRTLKGATYTVTIGDAPVTADYLKITSNSNFFGTKSVTYRGNVPSQVTVLYYCDTPDYLFINGAYYLNYDPAVLQFNEASNTTATRPYRTTAMPITDGVSCFVSYNPGSEKYKAGFNFSSLQGFSLTDNSGAPIPVVRLVFDVVGGGDTDVTLTVDTQSCAEKTGYNEKNYDSYGDTNSHALSEMVERLENDGADIYTVFEPEGESEEPVDGTYVLTGNDWLNNWTPDPDEFVMMPNDDGTYSITVPNVPATPQGENYSVKVVEYPDGGDAIWHGLDGGNQNVDFRLTGDGDVTVTYNPATGEITVTGPTVTDPVYDISYITAVGEGAGSFLNGVSWNPDEEANRMTEVSDGVYEITFRDIDTYTNYQVKFAANGGWDINWGFGEAGASDYLIVGAPNAATFNGGNAYLIIEDDENDTVDLTLRLDLTQMDWFKKTGATITVMAGNHEEPVVGGRLLGDVDGDGKVDIFDVSSIQKSLAGTSGYVKYDTLDKSSIEFRVADVDKNGQVDIYDASLIQKWMAGNAKAQTYGIGEPM